MRPRVKRLPGIVILSLGLWGLAAMPAAAQQIQWRQDYNQARQEAREKNLPIFMDVYTQNCPPCKMLEATTFRDPAVVKIINENFIPIKIDGNKHGPLVQALNIEGFPTLVFATSQGKVLGMKPGYVNAAAFRNVSQQMMARAAPQPEQGPLQLTAAKENGPPGSSREGQARALLALAEEEFRTQQYICCLMRCKFLAAAFSDLPEGQMAHQLAGKLKSDPERLRQTCENLTQSLCELYLELADSLIKQGQPAQAEPYLQWITAACPGTPHAEMAQQFLANLKK